MFFTVPYLQGHDVLSLRFFHDNDEWDLKKPVRISQKLRYWEPEDNQVDESLDTIVIHLELQRRHLFHVIIFVVPNALLYMLSGLVFVIPVESGEKISFAITILLAQFVSLGMISDMLPSSSLSFPKIGYFCEAAICHMALDSFFAIIGMMVL